MRHSFAFAKCQLPTVADTRKVFKEWKIVICNVIHVICKVGKSFMQLYVSSRVIDVGSEWRTFSNEANGTDRSRVGGSEVCLHLHLMALTKCNIIIL